MLRFLLEEGEVWSRGEDLNEHDTPLMIVNGRFTPLNTNELDNHLLHRGNCGEFGNNQVIYIKPPKKEKAGVAAIWCRWDFCRPIPKCGFYLGLWFQASGDQLNEETPRMRTSSFIGYRYETPGEGDNHNFYHVQPCRSMGDRDEKVTQALAVPERNPTWPLAAESSLELLLCLVVSLYGMKGLHYMREQVLEDIRQNRQLGLSINKILDLRLKE